MSFYYHSIFLVIFCLAAHQSSHAQTPTDYLTQYTNSNHVEKLYISNNQPFYLPEETIHGSIFLADGRDHLLITGDIICTVEFIDQEGKILHNLDVKLEGGRGAFSIKLDEVTPVGSYTLRAYTQYQLNFEPEYLFQKEIKIVKDFRKQERDTADLERVNLKFYPEGGHLIDGVNTKVAFKATDDKGRSVNISGEIIDGTEQRVGLLKSSKDGMGVFNITPSSNQEYLIRLQLDTGIKSYKLPKSLLSGQALSINSSNEEKIIVSIPTSENYNGEGHIVAHCRGNILFSRKLSSSEDRSLILSRSTIPTGIIHFTLFDADQVPTAQRLVWNRNPEEQIQINTLLKSDKISASDVHEIGIKLISDSTNTIANASVSIYNQSVNSKLKSHLNIENYLLLQSDLRGRIENIDDYFKDNSAESRFLIDLLMLTHGWRRFQWSELSENQTSIHRHSVSEFSTLYGFVKSTNKKECSDVKVELSVLGDDFFQATETTSDKDCKFKFEGIDLTDATSLHFQASTINQKNDKVNSKYDITINEDSLLPTSDTYPLKNYQSNLKQNSVKAPVVYANEERIMSESLWSFELENITIKSSMNRAQKLTEKAKKRYEDIGLYHISTSQKFDPTKPEFEQYRQQTIFQMIQHVAPNCKIVQDSGRTKLILGRFSQRYEPPIFLDGVEMEWYELEAVDPESIAIIDFPEGLVAASVYGNGAVISLLTKDPSEMRIKKTGILQIPAKRYHVATEYFDDHPISFESFTADLRTCLYWKPILKLNNDLINLQFKTSELLGEHVIRIEGITNTGIPFCEIKEFTVNK